MAMTFTAEQRLHDRATRGEQLSAVEQAQLDAWYDELNRQEAQALFGQDEPTISINAAQKELVLLRQQVDESLAQLNVTTQRLQEVSAQNKVLRGEIANLRAKIAEQSVEEAV